MKYLVVYRGMNNRVACVDRIHTNFVRKIKQPLLDKGHSVDVILTSYDDEKSKEFSRRFSDLYKPLDTLFLPSRVQVVGGFRTSTQADNFVSVMELLQHHYKEYERLLILRYELVYKTNINSWNVFESYGIFFPYKEDNETVYKTHNYVCDGVIIMDCGYFQRFLKIIGTFYGLYKTQTPIPPSNRPPFFLGNLHDLKTMIELADKEFPINFMFDGYFQSNTECADERASPLYVMLHRHYPLNDLHRLEDDS